MEIAGATDDADGSCATDLVTAQTSYAAVDGSAHQYTFQGSYELLQSRYFYTRVSSGNWYWLKNPAFNYSDNWEKQSGVQCPF